MQVWRSDQAIDDIYNAIFRELVTYMMEDPRSITPCTHLLFIAKNLERIGDHATNIAETVYFAVPPGSRAVRRARPKGDDSAYAVVRPREGQHGHESAPWSKSAGGATRPLVLVVEDEAALADHAALQPGKAGLPGRGSRWTARKRSPASPSCPARHRAAGLDAAGDVRHRGLPPDPPAARPRATCRSSWSPPAPRTRTPCAA